MKRLVIYSDDPDKGGVAQYNHRVALALAARGFAVTCIQPRSASPMVKQQEAAGVRHEWVGYDPGADFTRSITDTADASALFERIQPDLVIFSDCCAVSNLAAKHIVLAKNLPVVTVVHFVAPYLAERFKNCIGVVAKQHAQMRQVVAVSTENLGLLHRLFGTPSRKGIVIHNGRPAEYFSPPLDEVRARLRKEMDVPTQAVVCFAAARITAIKGFQHIVAAAATLKATQVWKDLRFVWAGDGELRTKMQQHIDVLGMSGQFRLLGQRWDVCDLYSAADIFTLPSHFEGMPLTVMEAMARGLPVVASAVSGIPEELGDTGQLIADPGLKPDVTTRALAETIGRWAMNPVARRAAGERCRVRAQQMFREELMLERLLALIDSQF